MAKDDDNDRAAADSDEESHDIDPLFRELVKHLPIYGYLPADTGDFFDNPICRVVAGAWEEFDLKYKLRWLSNFATLKLKGRPGRPKGTRKPHTAEAESLWREGYTRGEIGRELRLSDDELRKVMERLRRARARMPKEERSEARRSHLEGKEARQRKKSPKPA